jgi:hypothetical protein
MVLPLYQCWAEEFENTKECLQQLESNLNHWKAELEATKPPEKVQEKEVTVSVESSPKVEKKA